MNNRVLVVDDDRTARNFIAGLLREVLRRLTAASGEEALTLAAQQPPAVVLLDIMMPGIDGYETCRRLKTEFAAREHPGHHGLRGVLGRRTVSRFELGADAYLVKPFDPNVLCSEVRSQFRFRETIKRLATIESQIQSQRRKQRAADRGP